MNIRNKLKQARKDKKMTQVFVAKCLGMSETSYQRLEAGVNGTSEENWLKLFDLFGKEYPLNELMKNKSADESLSLGNFSDSSTKK